MNSNAFKQFCLMSVFDKWAYEKMHSPPLHKHIFSRNMYCEPMLMQLTVSLKLLEYNLDLPFYIVAMTTKRFSNIRH